MRRWAPSALATAVTVFRGQRSFHKPDEVIVLKRPLLLPDRSRGQQREEPSGPVPRTVRPRGDGGRHGKACLNWSGGGGSQPKSDSAPGNGQVVPVRWRLRVGGAVAPAAARGQPCIGDVIRLLISTLD